MKKLVPLLALLALTACKSGLQRCTSDTADRLAKVASMVPGTDEAKMREKVEGLAADQCKAIEASCKAAKDLKPEGCAKYFP